MNIIDSHFHWLPRSVFELLCRRSDMPRATVNLRGGYDYIGGPGRGKPLPSWGEWFDLDHQLEYVNSFGHRVDVVNSFGPFSILFSDLPKDVGREAAFLWNEEMAAAQRSHPGRFWSSAAVPFVDTDIAIEVLDHAVNTLGLMGVNLPGSIGSDARIDAARLEPFYARVEELDIPIFLHPTDAVFAGMLSDDYGGALHLSLGRVFELSAAAMRLVFSGILERHPKLTLVLSHTGGDLAYQSGRINKYNKNAKLPQELDVYLRRMFTDTALPNALSMRLAIDYYTIDHVMYGSDYPCCDPKPVLDVIDELGLTDAARQKLFFENAVRILRLKLPAELHVNGGLIS